MPKQEALFLALAAGTIAFAAATSRETVPSVVAVNAGTLVILRFAVLAAGVALAELAAGAVAIPGCALVVDGATGARPLHTAVAPAVTFRTVRA